MLVLDDGQEVHAHALVLATGANYRACLPARDAERFAGSGLYYAATHIEAFQCAGGDVIMVGGDNSAGHAVINLGGYARKVHTVVRRALEATMPRYLVDRIDAAPNVDVWLGGEVQPCTAMTA